MRNATTCLLQLVERSQLSLKDDARSFVPDLAAMQILHGFDINEKSVLENNTEPITLQ